MDEYHVTVAIPGSPERGTGSSHEGFNRYAKRFLEVRMEGVEQAAIIRGRAGSEHQCAVERCGVPGVTQTASQRERPTETESLHIPTTVHAPVDQFCPHDNTEVTYCS